MATRLEQAKLHELLAVAPDNLGLIARDAAHPPGVPRWCCGLEQAKLQVCIAVAPGCRGFKAGHIVPPAVPDAQV